MTPLEVLIREEIARSGPMPVSRYMALCLAHPEHGYYRSRTPFGRDGDFITAPEVSQMFGELIGLWAADLWQRSGRPHPFVLGELGPGRGTLMADALRAARALPGFQAAAQVHFVETSPALRALQADRVPDACWHNAIDTLPDDLPAILIANEFFDALPIDQFDATGQRRGVLLDAQDKMAWTYPDSAVVRETCPAAQAIVAALAARPVALLVIDYGDAVLGRDTLQAVRRHARADPLADPGEADLTAHVDFDALRIIASVAGAHVSDLVTQGAFLRALGLDVRAARLARANPERARTILGEAARLADATQMGSLFKVMAITREPWTLPFGFR